ncbi:MAG: hypothetical protein QNJ09_08305, partial [Paracoccaceae bacterium]|nr:hypothetical protein [Paracoccaceae bacterium]
MSENKDGFSCALGSWALAAGAGLLAFVLLLVLGGWGWVAAIFIAGVLFAVLGVLFSFLFCRDLPGPGEVTPGEDRGLRAVPPSDRTAVSVTEAAKAG